MVGLLKRLALVVCVIAPVPVDVRAGESQASAPSAAPPAEQHCLWRVESATATVYLLGSIHMLRQDVYPLAPVIESAFENSDVLVLEIDILGQSPDDVMEQTMSRARYEEGETLKSALPEDEYMEVVAVLGKFGIPMDTVQPYRPWFIGLMVDQLIWSRLGLRADYGIDVYFQQKAAGHKPVLELESIEGQLAMFSQFSDEEQVLMLKWQSEGLGRLTEDFDELLDMWKRGDAAAMEQQLRKEITEDPRFEPIWKRLVDDRNGAMAQRIELYLAGTRRMFVVVGAGHLFGERGLVALLRQRGYKVEQL